MKQDSAYHRDYRKRNKLQWEMLEAMNAKLDLILESIGEEMPKPTSDSPKVKQAERQQTQCQFCPSTKTKLLRMAGMDFYRCEEHRHG